MDPKPVMSIRAASDLRRLLRPSLMVYTGQMTRAALGFGVSLLVARWLGPQDFGLFSLFIVTMIIGQTVLGEGLDPSVVRYYVYYARHNPSQADRILGSALVLRLLIGIPVALLGWAGAGWIAQTLFHGEIYALPLRLGLIGSFGAALWSFSLVVFQAREDFATYSIMMPIVNLLRLVSIPVLLVIGQFTLPAVLGLNVVFFYLCTLGSFWMLRCHLLAFSVSGLLFRDLLHFSKWTAPAQLCFVIQSSLGVPALSYFLGAQMAGIYAAGAALLLVMDYLTLAIVTVQLPTVSKLTGLTACGAYVRRSLLLCAGMALVLSPTIFLARWLILFLYGPDYAETIQVFQVLFVGFLATLITYPLFLVFYAVNRPYLYTITSGASLATWLAVGVLLIPSVGTIGAAWAALAARMVQASLIACILWGILARGARDEERKAVLKSRWGHGPRNVANLGDGGRHRPDK